MTATPQPQEEQGLAWPREPFRRGLRRWCDEHDQREQRALEEYVVAFTDKHGSIAARIKAIALETGQSEEACYEEMFSQPNAAAVIRFLGDGKE